MKNLPTRNLERWIRKYHPSQVQLKSRIRMTFRALTEYEREDLFYLMWKYRERWFGKTGRMNSDKQSFEDWRRG